MLSFMTSFMMKTKWAIDQSAISTWPCMNIVIFTHNLGNWLMDPSSTSVGHGSGPYGLVGWVGSGRVEVSQLVGVRCYAIAMTLMTV